MKKIYVAVALLSISAHAETVWVTPSNTICKENKGSISPYGVCQATWENAEKICRLHDGRLPTIEELSAESKKCKAKTKNKEDYVACYKKNGFLGSSSYWSSTTDKKYPGSAYGMNFYSVAAASGGKGNTVDVRCIK